MTASEFNRLRAISLLDQAMVAAENDPTTSQIMANAREVADALHSIGVTVRPPHDGEPLRRWYVDAARALSRDLPVLYEDAEYLEEAVGIAELVVDDLAALT